MKRVGIITMHRVFNYGSALQAYATQYAIEMLGAKAELIDYIFPNAHQKSSIPKRIKNTLEYFILNISGKLKIIEKSKQRFNLFYKSYFKLSNNKYYNHKQLASAPPEYDIYLTGSDQVWNPIHINEDTTFMLSFCESGSHRCAFAASMSTASLTSNFKELCITHLSKYKSIAVREESTRNLLSNLLNQHIDLVCDPVLLLKQEDWSRIEAKDHFVTDKPYLCVYLTVYSFNPYPEIQTLINKIAKENNLEIVYISSSKKELFKRGGIRVGDIGPSEFLSIIKNASFVITSSFHGTCFSLIYKKNFIAVTEGNASKDSRIHSLLKQVDALDREINIKANYTLDIYSTPSFIYNKINSIKQHSLEILKSMIY